LGFVVQQYPLFSASDEALWQAADSYMKMGDRFENEAADNYTKIVRDYPMSRHADAAREKLEAMKRPVPAADPKAVAHMKFEQEHLKKPGEMTKVLDIVRRNPDVHMAAKEGAPAMSAMRPPTPVSVPQLPGTTISTTGTVTGTGTTGSDVTATVSENSSTLDKGQDARQSLSGTSPAPGAATAAPAGTEAKPGEATAQPQNVANQPLPTNHVAPKKTKKQLKAEEEYRKKQVAAMQKAQADADAKKAIDDAAAKKQQPNQ
jgi:outer membrane protein assembly factor BamD